jgi:hypothetical protein
VKPRCLTGFCSNPLNPQENGVERDFRKRFSAGNEPWNTELQEHLFEELFYLSEIREDFILKLNRERNFSLLPDALLAFANRKYFSRP